MQVPATSFSQSIFSGELADSQQPEKTEERSCQISLASKVIIRSLQETDWENFRKLRLTALKDVPQAYGISCADEQSRTDEEWRVLCQDAQKGSAKWYMVAEAGEGNLVGMLGAVEISGEHMRHQVEIVQAYVSPQYRRLKIMENLFNSLKALLKNVAHVEQMIAWVTLHETQVGRKMFEKFGFTYAGKLSKTVKIQEKYYDCCWLEARI